MKTAFLKIEPTRDSIVRVADFVSETMESNNISIKAANKISIAVDEMYSNVVNYSQASQAEIILEIDQNLISVTIKDNGLPFDPTKKEDPDTHQSSQERKIGGLGIFMVKNLMTSLHYTYRDSYNCFNMELKM